MTGKPEIGEDITLAAISGKDESFLFEVFCSVAAAQFEHVDLPDNAKEQLLRSQFSTQLSQYRASYPDANFDLVMEHGNTVGNFYALRGPERYVLIDIALLPSRRGAGIGALLVESLLTEAHLHDKPVDAHVLKGNPAWHLWQRLGFRILEDDGVYLKIQATPES